MAASDLGRNDPCPCGSGSKFKKCCMGRVPWQQFIRTNDPAGILHLRARGKNLAFLQSMAGILQLDRLPHDHSWNDVKRAVTPQAVRELHLAVADCWPVGEDLVRVLGEEAGERPGLYIGSYTPESIARGVSRHSLYSSSILVIDPLIHPRTIRSEYSPVEHPERHIAPTLLAIRIWWMLAPWIVEGLAKVIRVPGDFDLQLTWDCMSSARRRRDTTPELQEIAEAEIDSFDEKWPDHTEYQVLWHPDSYFEETFRQEKPDATDDEVAALLQMVRKRRREHPFFPESVFQARGSQLMSVSSGTSYDMARYTAEASGAHLITDINYRWREIELDRSQFGATNRRWASFAKAFSGVTLSFVEEVGIDGAIELRRRGHLERFRGFLQRVWSAMESGDAFNDQRIEDLERELRERVDEAEAEWSKIDRSLLKWAGVEAAGVIGAGSFVEGKASLLAACILGAVNLGVSTLERRSFPKKYPAAFFLGREKK